MKSKGKIDWILATGSTGDILFDVATGQAETVEAARSADIASAVAAMLKACPLPRRAKVLILADSVFHQNVQLPRVQTNGLSDEELAAAISFEIEPFSSLSAEKGFCAFVPVPGDSPVGSWDVVQVDRGVLAKLNTTVRTAGCVLAGVSALPSGLSLADTASVADAFAEIARQFSGENAPFAIAVPRRENCLQDKAITIGVLATAVICLGCAVHCLYMQQTVKRLRPEVAMLSAKAAENAALSAKADDFNKKAVAVENERATRAEAERRLSNVRGAMTGFLSALAESCGDEAALSSIACGEKELSCKVGCFAVTTESAAGFMNRFSGRMSAQGWTISPGDLSESSRNVVSFSFTANYDPAFTAGEGK